MLEWNKLDDRRQRGRVVRALDLKSGGHGLESRSDHLAGVVSWWTLVQLLGHSQLVCLPPVGIFKPAMFI